jgi:1,4-alpha-glucan branching enzyme
MGIKKQYLKNKPACKVTFTLPREAAGAAKSVHVVGDFNDWSINANPMRKLKDGTFTATVTIKNSGHYQFRYLLDGVLWENDWGADKYLPNEFGSDNSVLVVD